MGRVVILGSTGTIGSALARRLVGQGTSLLLLGRDEVKLQALGVELQQPYAAVDVSRSASLDDVLSQVEFAAEGFTGIVNCIGSLLLKPAHGTTDDEFRQVVETNLFSAFAAVKAGAKVLRKNGGSIVLFASAAAEIGIQNHEAIAAAKAGVIGLARSAAATYAASNIRVNVISPGLIRTELTRKIWDNPLAAAASVGMHALGRFGEAEQIASLAEWLLAAENHWITGQVIGVDGGLGHVLPRPRSGT